MAPKAECPGKERLENGQSECYDDFHNDESRESLLQDHDGQAGNHDLIALRKASWTPLILGIFLLSELMLLFFIFAAKARVLDECLKKHKSYSPAQDSLRWLEDPTRINGSFRFPSVYRGEPSPEIDEAWSRITDIGSMRISEEELDIIDPTFKESAVKYPDSMGGGYMGSLEVFHQLHCIDLLRRYSYEDYYKEWHVSWEDPPDILRIHINHCLELLRQKVMCDIDVGVLTYNWVSVRDAPWPNFNVWHKCMDFDSVLQWGLDHQVSSNGEKMSQTAGVTVLPTPP